MPLTEIVGSQERTYHDEELITHAGWGEILYVPDYAARNAIRKSNAQVLIVNSGSAVRWATTPAKELPKFIVELAKLRCANCPNFSYAKIVKGIDISRDFSFNTPRGKVVFKYPNPSETETAAE